jgi:predicted metal-binding membrane protein
VATSIETLLKRDRVAVGAALAVLTVLAWLYLVGMARHMAEMDAHAAMGMAMPRMEPWHVGEVAMLFAMWAVMMVGMMLPSAAPMILVFTTVNRRRAAERHPLARTGTFVLGYVIVWTAFSALAAVAQATLHSAALLSPMMISTSPYLGGALLIAAGVFQWTPLKYACLTTCRSPLSFLMTEWREGLRGALVMGLRHGVYCVGCCWMLMALLFVAGVMNLLWVAALALLVLFEKVLPGGAWIGRAAGVVLVVAGVAVMVV